MDTDTVQQPPADQPPKFPYKVVEAQQYYEEMGVDPKSTEGQEPAS